MRVYGADGANGTAHKKKETVMSTPSIELIQDKVVAIEGFEGEEIEVSVEQPETRTVPESLAGFLD